MTTSKSLAKPYARALFELATTKEERGLWLHRLQVLDKVFEDPAAAWAVSKQSGVAGVAWLQSVAGDKLDDQAYSLLALLLENHRLASLGDIRTVFADLMVELHGFGVLYVTSAVPLGDAERDRALKMFEQLFQKKLIPHYKVDPGIRGGLIGQVGDLIYDGSLRGSLEKMRETLIH